VKRARNFIKPAFKGMIMKPVTASSVAISNLHLLAVTLNTRSPRFLKSSKSQYLREPRYFQKKKRVKFYIPQIRFKSGRARL
jgi:hypothetical protein